MIMSLSRRLKFSQRALIHAAALMLVMTPFTGLAQTRIKPGFNLFSPQDDVQIGQQSAVEAERQLPILRDGRAAEYINRLGQTLASHAPGERYPYTFKIVNASDINAFALPGGPIYINRGTIEAARNEGELAGVLAHEIAHVGLRHGTNQASKAYLAQAGLGILGGLLGGGTAGNIIGAIGGFGLNTVFLKYSRDAETQADVAGAQMLARAGYNPLDMANFFETLQRESGRDPSKLESFFSDHPAPANRRQRIQQEAAMLGAPSPSRQLGDFNQVRSQLASLPRAPSMAEIARRGPSSGGGSRSRGGAAASVRVEPPSSNLRAYRQRDGIYQISYPENWRAYPSNDGIGVTFVPDGGAVDAGGQPQIIYGAVVNYYRPIGDNSAWSGRGLRGGQPVRGRGSLVEATNDLVNSILQNNPHLRVVGGSQQRGRIDQRNARTVTLMGRSPVTGRDERVEVYTRALNEENILYVLFISPNNEARNYSPTFDRMLQSLDINDQALRR
jgi:hypothetical protein